MASLIKDFTIVENDSKISFSVSKEAKSDFHDILEKEFKKAMNTSKGKIVMKKNRTIINMY